MKGLNGLKLAFFTGAFSLLHGVALSAEGNNGWLNDSTSHKPNMIIIMADDLGYGDIGCYGNTSIKTPNLDQLARQGVRFLDFHSNGAVCSPTRAALLTGNYQQRAGISGVITAKAHRDVGLPRAATTIAEVLKGAGYATGIFGKWHLGYQREYNPIYQGFDEFIGYVSGNVDYHSHVDQEGYYDWWQGDALTNQRGYSTDLISTNAIDFIRRNKDNPFFLYIAHEAPHFPFQNRASKADRYPGGILGKDFRASGSEEDVPRMYKDMVEIMDETVGHTLAVLAELGLENNTIVIFCSDNGASPKGSNGMLKGHKGSVWEGGHRVPAIFRWPGHIQQASECDETVLTMDIFPTVLELAGVENPINVDGVSIAGYLLHDEPMPERTLFWQHTDQSGGHHYAARKGKWKLVIPSTNKKPKLYDLESDPSETNDIADQYAAKVEALLEELNEWESETATRDLTESVNPFIGTGGHGHTFPGATLPFGMVQLSPDTRTQGWDACGGYHYSDSSILGFSHTHLSGTGIGDYGDILFMPFTGNAQVSPGTAEDPDSGYRSRFSHDQETATPGFYAVKLLDNDIDVELTATTRAGFHKYKFPKDSSKGIVIDLAHTINGHRNAVNEINVISDTEISGYKLTNGWAREHHVYFYAKFNRPFKVDLYHDRSKTEGQSLSSTNVQAVLTFDRDLDTPILAKVGISSVDYEGAKKNLLTEIVHWDFDEVKAEAKERWNGRLNKIQVKGGTNDQRRIFYTALYHASISPNIFNDVDGRYRGMDHQIHRMGESPEYTVFSLWDTFRAFHPLLTIIDPQRNEAFINSLLTKYQQGGVLPKWELAANYTGTMVGDHAIPVIYDAYKKGARGFDIELAYQAMKEATIYDTTGILAPNKAVLEKLKPKAKYYNETLGFIPADLANESVSKALEFAYNDWCVAQLAKDLGKDEDYELFMDRSKWYQKYFDKETGFMRGKNRDGSWREPFNPRFSRHRKDEYTEGNAWQWTWFVPHDVTGLVELMGGVSEFQTKLDSLFSITSEIEGEQASNDISGLIGQYAHGNEPSHHVSHLYNFVGQPWKTQQLTDSIMNMLYFNDPNGLSGNEDCGQMSAWYVLNAMGFYSFCPGDPQYSIGRPLFDEVILNLANGNKFIIKASNNAPDNKYIQSAELNSTLHNKPFFSHEDIMSGRELHVEMGSQPNKEWGIGNEKR